MNVEIRTDKVILEGYANSVSRDSRELKRDNMKFVEQIAPGTWSKALSASKDIKLLFNHDESKMLGSISDGNLELKEDNIGLKVKCSIYDTEIIKKARNGLLTGWSFGFIVIKDKWEDTKNGIKRRIIEDLNLLEISVLDETPAYIGTSIEARSLGEKEVRSYSETRSIDDTLQSYIDGFINGRNTPIIENNILESESVLTIKDSVIPRVPLFEKLDEIGNLIEKEVANLVTYSLDTENNKLILDSTHRYDTNKTPIILEDVYEDIVDFNGVKFIERCMVKEIVQDIENRLHKLFSTVSISKDISNVNDFILTLESIPKVLRRNLYIIGDKVEIAKLKTLFAKNGINSDNFFGIDSLEQDGPGGLYIASIEHILINYVAKQLEFRKKLDIYDFKINVYGFEGFTNNQAVVKLNVV